MTIVQLTDLHLDAHDTRPYGVDTWDNFRWALSRVSDIDPDLVVITGDLCLSEGNEASYHLINAELTALPCDVLVLPGNHDARAFFHPVFGRRYRVDHPQTYPWLDRSVEVGGRPMLLIDSADGALADPQLAWLEAVLDSQLRAARRGSVPRVLPVWIHHPVITGFHAYMDASYPLRNADALRELFTRGGHDLRIILFCGHYHCEDQRSLGPLTQWTTPSLYSQIDPNSRELTILPAGAGLRIVRWADDEEIETAVVYREP